MNYLLDTNAVIALLKNHPPGVRSQLRRVVSEGASMAVSSVVLYELWYGVARSERRPDLLTDVANAAEFARVRDLLWQDWTAEA